MNTSERIVREEEPAAALVAEPREIAGEVASSGVQRRRWSGSGRRYYYLVQLPMAPIEFCTGLDSAGGARCWVLCVVMAALLCSSSNYHCGESKAYEILRTSVLHAKGKGVRERKDISRSRTSTAKPCHVPSLELRLPGNVGWGRAWAGLSSDITT